MMKTNFMTYYVRITYVAGLSIGILAMVFVALTSISNSAEASTGQIKYSKDLIKRMVVIEAQSNGVVPPALAMAVAKVESNFQAHVKSSAGARGVMQIMPTTARGEFGVGAKRLWDPKVNIHLGVKYLEQLYRQYDNRWDMALSHYNGGTIKNGRPHSYTRKYVSDVMGYWQKFQRSDIILALTDTESNKLVKVNKYSLNKKSADRLNQRLAADYWLLDDPKTDKNWREYLAVADRWLNHDGNGMPAGFERDAIPYGSGSESYLGKPTLRERFKASLNRIDDQIELNGSARFM